MSSHKSLHARSLRAVLLFFTLLVAVAPAFATSNVVISQVYGGGGNSGAVYKNDFIELFNRGTEPVDLSLYSVQYASASGTTWQFTKLSGTLQPGHYYLVQEAAGSGGTTSLPTPDATGTIAMGATAGKVALVKSTLALTGSCPAAEDLVPFGAANCSSPTPAPSNTTAVLRGGGGCNDTDLSANDFTAGAPNPRNSYTTPLICAAPTNPSVNTATPIIVDAGMSTVLQASITPGMNPASTGLTVKIDLSAIGGVVMPLADDGTNGDALAGDNLYSASITVPANAAPSTYALPITLLDAQGRSGNGTLSLTVPVPPLPAAIHDIQGNGLSSPFEKQRVAFTGIVTARVSNGFYMELPDAEQDGDPATSEGVFVYTGSAPSVLQGDGLKVLGTVSEYNGLTEIASPSFTVLSSMNPLPSTVDIAPDANGTFDQLERYEGMLVRLANPRVVGPTGGSSTSDGIFYVTSGSTPRPFRGPGLEPGIDTTLQVPGAPKFDGNPERVRVDTKASGNAVSIGTRDLVADIVGPLGYSSDYTIYPDASFSATSKMAAVPLPERGAREFTVGSFNMLNFSYDSKNPYRLNKASLAIRNIMRAPDIIGVEEVDKLSTLQALADKINGDAQGNLPYAAQLLATSGAQNVGVLYRTDRITDVQVVQVGDDALMLDSQGKTLVPVNDRPPLVLTGKVLTPDADPFPITVIINHLRSLIDVDTVGKTGDFARRKRQLGAEYLAKLIAQHQANHEHVISVGDYNAYEFSDGLVDVLGTVTGNPAPWDQVLLPSQDLVDPNPLDLVTTVSPEKRYSYVENGNAQTLDHLVVSRDLLVRPYHLEIAHNNAEFPGTLATVADRPERVSDHDMPVGYFTLPPIADLSLKISGDESVLSGAVQRYTLTLQNAGPDAAANITLIDSLPAGTTVSNITAPAGWNCSTSGGSLQCAAAALASGSQAQFTLELLSNCGIGDGARLLNVAGVTSSTTDPDDSNNKVSHEFRVLNPPPQITGLAVNTPVLWSPNHKLVPITLSYSISDNCDTSLLPTVTIKSNQDVTASGPHAGDWQVLDKQHVLLRAERSTPGDRVYTITLTVSDSAGNPGVAAVQVTVPQSQAH